MIATRVRLDLLRLGATAEVARLTTPSQALVSRLLAQGHDPVPASPSTGVDTITGDGLADAMLGADVVVDVSNAPVWGDEAVMNFFTTSSRNLLAVGAPIGGRIELGGPEALGIDAWARRLFAATGDNREVIADPHARYYGTELHGGELTPGEGARIGKVDFDTWFGTNQPPAS